MLVRQQLLQAAGRGSSSLVIKPGQKRQELSNTGCTSSSIGPRVPAPHLANGILLLMLQQPCGRALQLRCRHTSSVRQGVWRRLMCLLCGIMVPVEKRLQLYRQFDSPSAGLLDTIGCPSALPCLKCCHSIPDWVACTTQQRIVCCARGWVQPAPICAWQQGALVSSSSWRFSFKVNAAPALFRATGRCSPVWTAVQSGQAIHQAIQVHLAAAWPEPSGAEDGLMAAVGTGRASALPCEQAMGVPGDLLSLASFLPC